jgi:hypothetical protein
VKRVEYAALRAALALAILLHARGTEACAGCRNPSLAVTRNTEGPLPARTVRAGLSVTGTSVHVVHEAGCRDPSSCEEVPVQPSYLHDQRLYPVELRLSAEYGIDENFGVELQIPFRVIPTTIEYTTPEGAPYEPLDAGVHHRDETVTGLADPWLLARIGGSFGDFWLSARPGVSLPLGRTEENPFELGDRGLRHQHIQLGSGTFDPLLVLEASRALGDAMLQLFAQGQLPFYENEHGYRAPWRVYGGAALGTKLGFGLSGFAGLEASHEDAERWDGELRQDGNLGRTELLAAATLRYGFGSTELFAAARFPIWRKIVTGDEPPGTLSSPVIASFGVSQLFGPGASR